ncbi:MAG: transposase [Gomphosphaeria aponina SAG 52.96 = DSM 107014]|uniref:Transposase n=1 Tax=Gomphosphaeria aponina SAG 52.96 = DSM 107014 TaxID=1521640 RepID=A0A941GQ62_9CHRO|nr:transposase [Gomphosphaeria aponina SAG 52.96 = DSM 107014]
MSPQITSIYCYHITIRCNNREFRLTRLQCRQVLLFIIKKAIEKYNFQLYGLCIMSNHIHYLIQPQKDEDIPKIMHYLNWYSAMCFNRMLNRTGHFWEKRYFKTSFPISDVRRALNTLRYIHANPKAAGMQNGFFCDFSNYGVYERLGDDGLTTWHPAFLSLGEDLEECASKYRSFCYQYKPNEKQYKPFHWGSQLLPKLTRRKKVTKPKKKKTEKQKKAEEEAKKLYEYWQENNSEIVEVAEKFMYANCYNKTHLREFLENYY